MVTDKKFCRLVLKKIGQGYRLNVLERRYGGLYTSCLVFPIERVEKLIGQSAKRVLFDLRRCGQCNELSRT